MSSLGYLLPVAGLLLAADAQPKPLMRHQPQQGQPPHAKGSSNGGGWQLVPWDAPGGDDIFEALLEQPGSEDSEPKTLSDVLHARSVDHKAVDQWFEHEVVRGLTPPPSHRDTAERDLDHFVESARLTFGDELLTASSPGRPARPRVRLADGDGDTDERRRAERTSLQDTGMDSWSALQDDDCWQDWEDWGSCSSMCWKNPSFQRRIRKRWPNSTEKTDCSGRMEETQDCNRNIACPPLGAASTSLPPFAANDTLGSCSMNDIVACPLPSNFVEQMKEHCHGNECCASVDRSGMTVTHVCPSAAVDWNDCNLERQIDCMGGMSGKRVQMVDHEHDNEIEGAPSLNTEPPIEVPTIGPFDKIESAAEHRNLATCNRHVCTAGWRLKFGLAENQPCETTPCTEVECCELSGVTHPPPQTSPCPKTETVEVPAEPHHEEGMSPAMLGLIIAAVAVGACLLGCYLGRKCTQFQQWRKDLHEEKAEEEMVAQLAEEEAAIAAAQEAAKAKRAKKSTASKKSGGTGADGKGTAGSEEKAAPGGEGGSSGSAAGAASSAAAAAADPPPAAGEASSAAAAAADPPPAPARRASEKSMEM